MRKLLFIVLLSLSLWGVQSRYASPHPTIENPRHAVFQFSVGDEKTASKLLSYIVNLQKGYEPGHIDVAVVCLNDGIFLLKKDTPFKERIESLTQSGVEFVACENTMETKKIPKADMLNGLSYTKTGMQELIERKLSGWVYLLP